VDNTGFAIVDTEPKRAAATSAAVKPITIDFVVLCSINRNMTKMPLD
jgi:hypothetical protein